jgi:hypothetical protein
MEKPEDQTKPAQKQAPQGGVAISWDAYTVFSLAAYVLLAAVMVGFAAYCIRYGAPDLSSWHLGR